MQILHDYRSYLSKRSYQSCISKHNYCETTKENIFQIIFYLQTEIKTQTCSWNVLLNALVLYVLDLFFLKIESDF